MKFSSKFTIFSALVLTISSFAFANGQNVIRFGGDSNTGNTGVVPKATPNITAGIVGDSILGEKAYPWSAWLNVGDKFDCGAFSPEPSTVTNGEAFTQTAECQQNQTRSRDIVTEFKSGKEEFLRAETENQTIAVQDTRSATGTASFVIGQETQYTSYVTTTPSCSGYSPSTRDVLAGTTFTQSRSCRERFTRDAIVYDVYNTGERIEVSRTSQTANGGTYDQTRSATGSMTVTSTFTTTQLARNCYSFGNVDRIDVHSVTTTRYSNNSQTTSAPFNRSSVNFQPGPMGSSTPTTECQWYVFLNF